MKGFRIWVDIVGGVEEDEEWLSHNGCARRFLLVLIRCFLGQWQGMGARQDNIRGGGNVNWGTFRACVYGGLRGPGVVLVLALVLHIAHIRHRTRQQVRAIYSTELWRGVFHSGFVALGPTGRPKVSAVLCFSCYRSLRLAGAGRILADRAR